MIEINHCMEVKPTKIYKIDVNQKLRKLTDLELLFGECPSVIIVTIKESDLYNLVVLAKKYDMRDFVMNKLVH